jgi:hypothetical protein
MAAGFTMRQKSWSEASEAMERAYVNVAVRDIVLMDLARIKRIMSADAGAAIAPLAADSEKLKFWSRWRRERRPMRSCVPT